ncbi:hypothetical protein EHM76_04495 [bacterium]|nr:MAG: hypothetical protein EHM76_04495 [bacterium]
MYFDDDEELNEYRRRFGAGGASAPSYDLGSPQLQTSMGQEYDPQAVAGYLAQKPQQQTYSDPGPSVVPMRVDDRSWLEKNGYDLAMAGLDIATNGGRGLGRIAQAGMQRQAVEGQQLRGDFENDRQAWQRQQGQEYGRAMDERRFAGDDADRALRSSDQALRQRQSDELHQRYMQSNDPNSPQSQAELRRMNALAAEAEARAGRDPNALTPYQQAQLELEREQMGASAQQRQLDREDRVAARGERSEDRELARQGQADQRAFMNEQRTAAAHQGQLNKFRDETERSRPQLTRAMEVEDIVTRNPGDVPGVGRWDSIKGKIPLVGEMLSSRDDIAMRGNLTDMADLILRERSGAAAPPIEVIKLAENIAAGGGATEKEFGVLQGEFNRLLRGGLQQQSVGREDAAREVLGGRADWALGPRAPQSAAPAQSAGPAPIRLGQGQRGAPSGGRVNFPSDGSLPVTDQRRNEVPRVDDYLNGQGAGQIEIEGDMYSPDEVEVLRRMGVIR